jgi:hypothetical protein
LCLAKSENNPEEPLQERYIIYLEACWEMRLEAQGLVPYQGIGGLLGNVKSAGYLLGTAGKSKSVSKCFPWLRDDGKLSEK